MTDDNTRVYVDLVNYRISRFKDKLYLARVSQEKGINNDAISNCYYAAFNITLALLALKGITEEKSHKQVINEFSRRFVKTRDFATDSSKRLTILANLRNYSDYGSNYCTIEQVNLALSIVEYIVRQAESILNRHGFTLA